MNRETIPHFSELDPAQLAAANICPTTGLATDYLNHYNEVAMLVDMLSCMPEALEEILAWAPRGYTEHFAATGFRERELAVAAYLGADPGVRAAFDQACQAVEAAIAEVQRDLRAGADPAPEAATTLYELIAQAGGVILGAGVGSTGSEQAAIDAMFD